MRLIAANSHACMHGTGCIRQSQARARVSPASVLAAVAVAPRAAAVPIATLGTIGRCHPAAFRSLKTNATLYDVSLSLSRTPTSGNAPLEYTMYDRHGRALGASAMTKVETAAKYGLGARDLRTIDLPFHGYPRILVRDSTLVLYIYSLRILVQADHVLLFHVQNKAADEEQDNMVRLFRHHVEEKADDTKAPYELGVLDAALSAVTATLQAEYVLAKRHAAAAFDVLDLKVLDKNEAVIHEQIRGLFELSRDLSRIEQRARHVRTAVQEVLNDDGDMAAMYLGDKRAGRPHAVQDHQEVEYLFEGHFKASDAVVQEAVSLMGEIRRIEESTQSSLNVRRNQIMVLEAKIEILMVGMAGATLVAGLYGMNVVNYLEESTYAFAALGGVCVLGILAGWRVGVTQLRMIQKGAKRA